MTDERRDDAPDHRTRADDYASARIASVPALTIVLVVPSIKLTPSAYAHGMALALPTKAALARPTGVGRALATYEIPIEGRDEWAAVARRLA